MSNPFLKIKFVLLGIALLALSLQVMKLSRNQWLIGSDGLGYYAHVRSLIIDHDLNYSNEFRDFNPFGHCVPDYRKLTTTGHVANKYPIGPALLWSPFFILAHASTIFLNFFGLGLKTDGYSFLYQFFIGTGTIFYGLLGLHLTGRIANRYFPEHVTAAAIGIIFLSTNILYYFINEPSMSHVLSMFAVSLFLHRCLKDFGHKNISSFLSCGLAAGLMIIMRYQNVFFMIIPLIEVGITYRDSLLPLKKKLVSSLKSGLVFLFGAGLSFLPQLIVLVVIYGITPMKTSPGAGPIIIGSDYSLNSFNFLNPKLQLVLFSPQHGLIYWTPIVAICLMGLALFTIKNRLPGIMFILCFACQWYINAAWHCWSFGNAFGARAFINCTPFFVVGLATVLDCKLLPIYITRLVLGSLVAANLLFVSQFILHMVSGSGPVLWSTVFSNQFELLTFIKNKLFVH